MKIIVNDGSSDDRYYNFKFDNKTKVKFRDKSKKLHGYGPGSIRNFGTDISDGHFLAFLDDDDIWLPDKLKIQVEAMLSAKYLPLQQKVCSDMVFAIHKKQVIQ